MNDNGIINLYINKVEDEHTVMAKHDYKDSRCVTINAAHATKSKPKPKILQNDAIFRLVKVVR